MRADSKYFDKQVEARKIEMHRIKARMETRNDTVRGRDRDSSQAMHSRRKVYQTMEDKFRDHSSTFKGLVNGEPNKLRRLIGEIGRFDNIWRDADQVCQDVIPNIGRIRSEDKKLNTQWHMLRKEYERNLDVNVEAWQKDKHYQLVKEELIHLQQDEQLPEYYRFCLINNKETMKRMNRSNQEVKETSMLFALKDKLKPEMLKNYMERCLRKYQRIQMNQELLRDGIGWRLISKPSNSLASEDDILIQKHMMEKKPITLSQQLKSADKLFVRQLKAQVGRDKNQGQQNPIISQFKNRIFKTEQTEKCRTIHMNEDIKEIDTLQKLNEDKLQLLKTDFKQALHMIKKAHVKNYRTFQQHYALAQ